MDRSPFALLAPYADHLEAAFLDRSDAVADDARAEALLGGPIAATEQVHGADAVRVRGASAREAKADGMATDVPGVWLTSRSADCQTFVAYAPGARVAGVLHAGWRGLLAGMIPTFFGLLRREWEIDGGEVLVGAAPSLCGDCSDFTDPAAELPGIDPRFFAGTRVHLRGIAEAQLADAGVTADRFERMEGCPRCDPAKWWSYRGDPANVRRGLRNVLACRVRG